MSKSIILSALLLLSAAPAALAQHQGHADHQAAGASRAGAPIHKVVTAKGVAATFHLQAPAAARYTCSMHPEVSAERPGSCPTCKMTLAKQTHRLELTLADAASKRPISGAKVHLAIVDGQGMRQALQLGGKGPYVGAFYLAPGKQTLQAQVTGGGAAGAVVSTSIDVK